MRIAAIGDIHGREHLSAFTSDLDRLEPVDLFLLAGDLTDRNDIKVFGEVLETIRRRVEAPLWAVFGNNEYSQDHAKYVERFSPEYGVRFLRDEAAVFEARGERLRIVGSLGSLDRPTYWQRRNLPHLEGEYKRRIGSLDRLLQGSETTLLLTHYPPTYVTMGGEKEEWRPELGCRALEPVLLRNRPRAVVHGHIHKGIPYAELRPRPDRLDAFVEPTVPVPVHNVAYPVRRSIPVLEL